MGAICGMRTRRAERVAIFMMGCTVSRLRRIAFHEFLDRAAQILRDLRVAVSLLPSPSDHGSNTLVGLAFSFEDEALSLFSLAFFYEHEALGLLGLALFFEGEALSLFSLAFFYEHEALGLLSLA